MRILWLKGSALLFLTALLSGNAALAGTEYRTPGSVMKQKGVAAYLVEQDVSTIKAQLLGPRHQDLGLARIEIGLDRTRNISFTKAGATLGIRWSIEAGDVILTAPDGGTSHLTLVDGAWASTNSALLSKYRHSAEMAAQLLEELKDDIRAIERAQGITPPQRLPREIENALGASQGKRPASSATLPLFRSDAKVVECTGGSNRGDSTATTRSACCEEAALEAGSECWNSACVGCCSLGSCDAACAIGDYFCVCGVTGQECGAQ